MEKQFAEDPCDAINLVLNNRKYMVRGCFFFAKISFKGICEKVINITQYCRSCHFQCERYEQKILRVFIKQQF